MKPHLILLSSFLFFTHNSFSLKPRIFKTETRDKIEETFIDSNKIGRPGSNKIELRKYRTANDSVYATAKFYTKQNGSWKLKSDLHLPMEDVARYRPQIADFNGDGLGDITYVSAQAARGANELRSLLIYDKITGKLIPIKNADQYPNLRYNKKLNCIDAFAVYGGCATIFLKLERDNLRKFAEVELMDGLTVTVYDKNGRSRVIRRDKKSKETFIRYKNFNPLEENNDD